MEISDVKELLNKGEKVDIYSWGLKKTRKRSCRRNVFRFRV